MERIYDTMYDLDIEKPESIKRDINKGDIQEYIIDLIDQTNKNKNKKSFVFESDKVEIYTLIKEIFESNFSNEVIDTNSGRIADRLVSKEKSAQERYGHITKIQKGNLIQSVFQQKDKFVFLIAKIELEEFLDSEDFQKQIGLPFENRILKTCLIEVYQYIDEEDQSNYFEIEKVYVADSNKRISNYWCSDFLELKELNTDENNTDTAYKCIERVLARETMKKSPQDYNVLRNNLIGYFQTQNDFTINGLVEYVFGDNYEPESDEIDIDKLKTNLFELPEKKGFDTQFGIVKNIIKARRVFKVNDKIEIKFKDHIDRLKHIVFAKKDQENKYIYIKTDNDSLFEQFNFKG